MSRPASRCCGTKFVDHQSQDRQDRFSARLGEDIEGTTTTATYMLLFRRGDPHRPAAIRVMSVDRKWARQSVTSFFVTNRGARHHVFPCH